MTVRSTIPKITAGWKLRSKITEAIRMSVNDSLTDWLRDQAYDQSWPMRSEEKPAGVGTPLASRAWRLP